MRESQSGSDRRGGVGASGGLAGPARLLALAACAAALVGTAGAGVAGAAHGHAGVASTSAPVESATLEGCVTSVVQAERSATFSGEMTAVSGAARMAMRIDVQERLPGEAIYHTISAPGLGVWRSSEPKVKIYKYLKQVTNLSSPAVYRGLVRFRWMSAKGRVVKRAERLTQRCEQPASPPAGAVPSPQPTSASSVPAA